jgi:hypothetical protein
LVIWMFELDILEEVKDVNQNILTKSTTGGLIFT